MMATPYLALIIVPEFLVKSPWVGLLLLKLMVGKSTVLHAFRIGVGVALGVAAVALV